jgi:metallo-beta-lactamase class B
MRAYKFLPLLLLSALPILAQATGHEAFNKPFPAYKVIGNIYFVGTDDLGSFLITTPEGNILINSDFDDTVPQIRASVEKLGFKFTDTKILLGSHAHGDHMEGDARVKELTGAGDGDGAGHPGDFPHDAGQQTASDRSSPARWR